MLQQCWRQLYAPLRYDSAFCVRRRWGNRGRVIIKVRFSLKKMHPKFYFPYWNQKQFFFFCTLLKALANVTIKGCLTASTGTCFITVGRIEFTSKKSKELWDQRFQNNCSCNLRIKSPFLYFLSSTLRQSCGILKITQFEEREKYCDLWITCIYLY